MARTSTYSSRQRSTHQSSRRRVSVHPHALAQARKRRSPIKFAVNAVAWQLPKLALACPIVGSRAAVDYSEGRAVVQRLPDGRVQIRTILEWWMAVDNLPTVYHVPPEPARERTHEQSKPQSGASIGAILAAKGQMTRLRSLRAEDRY